ncbi:MAG: efflux RND transporter periplasmic adaptor subunit [Thermodesulfovibrionia bacterium]|nr:efflux RND transporter periplasmic adaptor subunit [Thermodesulfovibrionia bacterium]
MRKWVWVLMGIVVLSALFYVFSSNNKNGDLENLKTELIKKGDLKITVAATGVVTPYVEVEVKSKAGGEIVSFPFEEGDILKKGDVAVKLDPETEQSRVNQANADLLVADARLEKAKITLKDEELRLKRQRSLFEDKVISRQDLDNAVIAAEMARSDVKIAEAELIRAREALKEAKDRLKDTEITAPLNGTILKKYAEEGQVIASTTSSVSEGTLLFTMADLNRLYIEAMVDETDIGRIKPGQTVSITADAYLGKTFRGNIIRISPQGRVESTITVFDVTIEVEDKDKTMLKPVMTANAEILIELTKNVLLVSSEAVRSRRDETGVYKIQEEEPVWNPVSTGKSNGILTEIYGDIKEGDEVVLSGIESNYQTTEGARNLRRGFWFFRRKR